jgi:hypothetical protein
MIDFCGASSTGYGAWEGVNDNMSMDIVEALRLATGRGYK